MNSAIDTDNKTCYDVDIKKKVEKMAGTSAGVKKAWQNRKIKYGALGGKRAGRKPANKIKQLLKYLPIENQENCWIWKGSCDVNGRAILSAGGKLYKAYRIAYEHFVEPLDSTKQLHHKCNNPKCVNYHHLEIVTPAQHIKKTFDEPTSIRTRPSGTEHWTNKNPEKVVRGEKWYQYQNTEKHMQNVPRGEWWHITHPKENRKFGIMPADKNPMAKLTWEQVREIRKLYETGRYSQQVLANQFGINQTKISDIIRKTSWKE